ncbi:phosphoenolpyruvate carboxykinase (ATP)-like [Zingiber officinale]|uniref:phosphoenolpyruvate carboxykinase (ATP)-like n=1 Tax=Zingiber officinale TaxID=94328 RepID=UPI001C4C6E22|nr:phosphoenolpyruvate carboxykinase (ATP)-like [Zingiber officinale]
MSSSQTGDKCEEGASMEGIRPSRTWAWVSLRLFHLLFGAASSSLREFSDIGRGLRDNSPEAVVALDSTVWLPEAPSKGIAAATFSNGLPKIQTQGREKPENGICHDDSASPVKAKTIDELHSLQKKRSAPTTPIKDGAQQGNVAFATISEEERQKLQSIRCIHTTLEELEDFSTPDFTIYNAGQFPCNRYTHYMTTSTSIDLNLDRKEMVILGTQYAGEMKKGLFGVMHYLMPKRNILSLHSSNNMGKDGDVALFFGLSGTGKTTLSTDHNRLLIGDDEHCWSENGISNIEGCCYAKCIGLTKEKEPDIWNAIKFGTVLENIVFDEHTREVDYSDNSIIENTRASYPIEYIPNVKIPYVSPHPKNVILLACDAFGMLPPVSKLTLPQTMYHFISGYTALFMREIIEGNATGEKDSLSSMFMKTI